MHVRFYLDPETGQPHIYRHEVDELEVEDVLRKPGEDRQGFEGSRVAMGQTDPEPDSVFVITAYELTGKPLAAYRKRRKKRQTR